jgi:hypothetical protein
MLNIMNGPLPYDRTHTQTYDRTYSFPPLDDEDNGSIDSLDRTTTARSLN